MRGMNVITGEVLSGVSHLKQSIANILTTPIGSRVMRRDYGSNLFNLIDNPINGNLIAEIYADVYDALDRWEPRFELKQIGIANINQGILSLNLSGVYFENGKIITIENLTISSNLIE